MCVICVYIYLVCIYMFTITLPNSHMAWILGILVVPLDEERTHRYIIDPQS